ncbi:MAG: acyltransferase family protein [Sporichthyaceae bacterium]
MESSVGPRTALTWIPRQRGSNSNTAEAGAGANSPMRRDIQGLRGVAILLVLGYHLWPSGVPGGFVGVDVFFVISGFLITGQLLRMRPTGLRDLASFWERRVRRLAPAGLLVLAVCLTASYAIGPDGRRVHTGAEVAAATLNLENWLLAYRSVDYLAASSPPSPVQHYWSLSIEEQFYVLWPLLFAVAALLTLRVGAAYRTVVAAVLVPVVAGSLALTLLGSGVLPGAYFLTPLRIWQLGAGALVSVWLLDRRRGRAADCRRARAIAGLGLLAVAACGFGLVEETGWPNGWTLVPVLAATLILATAAPTDRGPLRLLGSRPMQYTGHVSYSLYLWHWPLIVLLPAVTGRGLTNPDKVAIVCASFALAALTKRYVEDRFRRPSTAPGNARRAFVAAAAAMAVLVGLCTVQILDTRRQQQASFAATASALRSADCFGAAAMDPDGQCTNPEAGTLLPSTLAANADRPRMWSDGCLLTAPYTGPVCRTGPADAKVRVALVGNSRGGHWQPTLQAIAQERGWALATYTAQGCAATSVEYLFPTAAKRQACLEWGRRILRETTGGQFDLVVISQFTGGLAKGLVDAGPAYPPRTHDHWVAGYRDYLATWVRAGVPVLVLRDVPMPRTTLASVPDCLSAHRSNFAACSGARSTWVRPDPLVEAATSLRSPLASSADLTDWMCDAQRCFGAIGTVPVYFDSTHLGATFATTMAPVVAPYLDSALRTRS